MALEEEARICLISVLLGLIVVILPDVGCFDGWLVSNIVYFAKYILAIIVINAVTAFVYKGNDYQVG